MKMVYERPMMKAEAFMANEYVAACGDPVLKPGQQNITIAADDISGWYNVPRGGDHPITTGGVYEGSVDSYFGLEFTNRRSQTSGTTGDTQYYWTATRGSDTYYLEYSDGWTENGGNTNDIFVLYKEDGYDSPYGSSNPTDELNINWNWTGSNDGSGSNLLNWFDTVIAGLIFKTRQVDNS